MLISHLQHRLAAFWMKDENVQISSQKSIQVMHAIFHKQIDMQSFYIELRHEQTLGLLNTPRVLNNHQTSSDSGGSLEQQRFCFSSLTSPAENKDAYLNIVEETLNGNKIKKNAVRAYIGILLTSQSAWS